MSNLEDNNLGTKRILAIDRPKTGTNKPITVTNSPQNVNQKANRNIGDVFREDDSGVRDCDSAPPAFRQVDVVDSGAGGDDEL